MKDLGVLIMEEVYDEIDGYKKTFGMLKGKKIIIAYDKKKVTLEHMKKGLWWAEKKWDYILNACWEQLKDGNYFRDKNAKLSEEDFKNNAQPSALQSYNTDDLYGWDEDDNLWGTGDTDDGDAKRLINLFFTMEEVPYRTRWLLILSKKDKNPIKNGWFCFTFDYKKGDGWIERTGYNDQSEQ